MRGGGNEEEERKPDRFFGQIPEGAVVVRRSMEDDMYTPPTFMS